MSWVRLDDGAPGHRKIVGLSDAAFRLWIVGLTHCNQQANDGRFSAHAARIMFGYLASPELGRGAIAELCTAGLWAETADGYEVHDYLEYQPSQAERASANKAAAERMRKMRAAKHGVREPLQRNTVRTSEEVPAKFSLPDPVPSRPDPVPVLDHTVVPSEPSQPALALQPQQAADSTQPKAQVIAQIAVTLFGELQAARKRCNANVRWGDGRKVLPAHTREIERCLREEMSVDDLRHVIAVWEAMVKSGRQEMAYFDSVTPFRAANVAKYLQMSLDDARKPRGQAPQATRPPEPPKSPRAGESDFQRQIRESRERGEIT